MCVCSTLWDPMDCRPPGSSVHRIFHARILCGLPFPLPKALPYPGIEAMSPVSPALQADSLSNAVPPGKVVLLLMSNFGAWGLGKDLRYRKRKVLDFTFGCFEQL